MLPENKKKLKENISHELHLVFFYTLFFAIFLLALSFYKSLILDEFGIDYFHSGYNLVEALILAKIVVIGQHFKLGERFIDKPLIIPTLYKTVIFTLFVFAFSILERIIEGTLIKKETIHKVFENLMSSGIYSILAKTFVLFLMFLLFFAILETGRVVGMDKLVHLFIRKKSN